MQSESNVKRVLCTKPEVGTTAWGLVEEGKTQAKNVSPLQIQLPFHLYHIDSSQAAEKLREMIGPMDGDLSEQLVVVTSDFTRTRETAEIIHKTLNVKIPLRLEPGLRERDVGDLDLKVMIENSSPSVFEVWEDDEKDVTRAKYNAESVVSVARRMSAVVKAVNQEFEGKIVLLVSHQDPLHILYSLFIDLPLPMHRKKQVPRIGNCDIRELRID